MPNVLPTLLLVTKSDALSAKIKKLKDGLPDLPLRKTETLAEARALIQKENILVVLVHATADMSDPDIVEFLHANAQSKGTRPALILADTYNDQQALACFRAGAVDYLSMPRDAGKLQFLLDVLTLRERPAAKPVQQQPAAPPPKRHDPFFYVVASPMAEMMEQARRVAPQDTTLLFTGETGTGKTRLARLIHDLSPRHDQPFVVVDCAALSNTLIESEIFGHVRGAFTGADRDRAGKFAVAGEGTLVLDEINALPLALQCKLLRAVDERVFEPVGSNQGVALKARLMAVSNAPLDQEVLAGRFRSDLFYRLNVVGFYLPPLRERRTAIAPLCHRFLAEFASRNRPDITGLAATVVPALEEYFWPGNIRELRNVIERAVALAKGPLVTLDDIPALVLSSRGRITPRPALPEPEPPIDAVGDEMIETIESGGTLDEAREEIEIQRIHAALKKHHNNRLQAAAELGISRMGLYKKLHKYGMFDVGKAM
jgi:two-component system response regulator HydG